MITVKRVQVTAVATAVVTVLAGGTIAVAANGKASTALAAPVADAPYVRAAAVVDTGGSLTRGKGIASVRRVSAGRYCVKVSASGVDVRTAVPQVSLSVNSSLDGSVAVSRSAQPVCGNDSKSFFVRTSKGSVQHNQSFILTVA